MFDGLQSLSTLGVSRELGQRPCQSIVEGGLALGEVRAHVGVVSKTDQALSHQAAICKRQSGDAGATSGGTFPM